MMRWLRLALIGLLLSAGEAFASGPEYPNGYQARVLHISDGDTVVAAIYSWPQHSVEARVRLRGIDAPEIRGKCVSEKQKAQAAKRRLSELTPEGSIIVLNRVELGTYAGRVIADIATAQYPNVAVQLLEEKIVRPYDIRRGRQSWC